MLVSACLCGEACRYDGGHCDDGALAEQLARRGERAVPFCPEVEGGLATPRPPAWIEARDAGAVLDGDARIVTEHGDDVTDAFLRGARATLDVCRRHGITRAWLKERSPSCGVAQTHVAGAAVDGHGVTAELLRRAGIDVRGV